MCDDLNINTNDLLKPINMVNMYIQGAFPMADETGIINWYQPKTRTIIPINNFNIPRSLKKFMQTSDFEYRINENTIEIIKNCASRNETWINDELIEAYEGIINSGFLHSVGVYQKNKLVGGLYGISFKGAFFGESMFSNVSQASKSALAILLNLLKKKNFTLLDVQYQTEHLQMFGTIEINFDEYSTLLNEAYSKETNFI